jgi:hypothetical protein
MMVWALGSSLGAERNATKLLHVTSTPCTPEGSGANTAVTNFREVPLKAKAFLGTVSMEVTVPSKYCTDVPSVGITS